MLHDGYSGFAHAALEERKLAGFPPFRHLALLRCESVKADAGDAFMQAARDQLDQLASQNIEVFGPVPAPMERRAGRYRLQLMLQSTERKHLHAALQPWIQSLQTLKAGNKVRWSLDVDPYDTY